MSIPPADYQTSRDLTVAERRGRAAIEFLPTPFPDGAVIDILADDSPDGHALLVAARWARLGRLPVRVRHDDTAGWSAVGLVLAENVRLLGLSSGQAPLGDGALIPGMHLTGDDGIGRKTVLPDCDAAWRIPAAHSAVTGLVRALQNARTVTCEESRDIDRRAIRDYSLPGINLMENAAVGAVRLAAGMVPASRSALVVAGGGNNGGDGLAVARGLARLGIAVEVVLLKEPERLQGDAASNYRFLLDEPAVLVHSWDGPEGFQRLMAGRGLVIDALLGTGFSGGLSDTFREAIIGMNRSGIPILALDIPSGLDGDTGMVREEAVRATATITFAAVKQGLRRGDGADRAGELFVGGIGI